MTEFNILKHGYKRMFKHQKKSVAALLSIETTPIMFFHEGQCRWSIDCSKEDQMNSEALDDICGTSMIGRVLEELRSEQNCIELDQLMQFERNIVLFHAKKTYSRLPDIVACNVTHKKNLALDPWYKIWAIMTRVVEF